MIDRIASTRADLEVILQRMRGEHRPSRSEKIAAAAAFIVSLAFAVWIVTLPGALWQRLGAAALAALFGMAVAASGLRTYVVTDREFRRRGFWSWSINAAGIDTIGLEQKSGVTLIITTTTDRSRRMPLNASARRALATLYPELDPVDVSTLSAPERATVRRSLGRMAWQCALIVAGGVALLVLSANVPDQWHWTTIALEPLGLMLAIGGVLTLAPIAVTALGTRMHKAARIVAWSAVLLVVIAFTAVVLYVTRT